MIEGRFGRLGDLPRKDQGIRSTGNHAESNGLFERNHPVAEVVVHDRMKGAGLIVKVGIRG